jgi:hypothetical protein
MTKKLYFMCGTSKDNGKTIDGMPFVRDALQLKATHERLKRQNNGEQVFVLSSASVNQVEQPSFHSPSDTEQEHLITCECLVCLEIPF